MGVLVGLGKKSISGIILATLLATALMLALNIQPVSTQIAPPAPEEAPKLEWNCTYGGGKDEYVYSVDEANDGGYVMAGATHSYGIGIDAWLVKTNSTGSVQWQRNYGGGSEDYAISVQKDNDGG